ncbi:MAG: type II toxin-antitoxin system PemK/MazF family toxin [bacterium]|nr:type II toxin-antitoxin system PemK/MazF family toxin [bacterium]
MVAPAAGAVVLVRFPFSDLSQTKLRPAVVLADAGRGDWVLCQVTSKPYGDTRAIKLEQTSFASGSLRVTSYARPGKLFTANRDLITAEVAALKSQSLKRVVSAVVNLLRVETDAGRRRGSSPSR